jgi:hypothetical protein
MTFLQIIDEANLQSHTADRLRRLSERGLVHDEAVSCRQRLLFCDNPAVRCRFHRSGRHLHLRIEWQPAGQRGVHRSFRKGARSVRRAMLSGSMRASGSDDQPPLSGPGGMLV